MRKLLHAAPDAEMRTMVGGGVQCLGTTDPYLLEAEVWPAGRLQVRQGKQSSQR
jgi:hypothetical protein